ncbi:MAG: ATP-dependent sacrificial sulfur transferase LarE [Candidatus Gastranaerophilales bacterium]|nr:ATP-dependent sacrificial sulfur transferase LarE [Candidatus Gastranaerophilales bacterium]
MMELHEFFAVHQKAALGFSGGVDSAYLLYAGVKSGADIRPYFIHTPFQPAFELADAKKLADELKVELTVIKYDILSEANVAANPPDRCYYCKAALFGRLREQALADGYSLLLDGTNASDLDADRPGMRALRELEVRSPLRECGLTKADIRRLSREAGLFTWDKPAYACLATRVPAGERLCLDLLQKIERAEEQLFSMGFSDFRVRIFHDAARVQLLSDQLELFLERRGELITALKPDFPAVLLDMETRDQ